MFDLIEEKQEWRSYLESKTALAKDHHCMDLHILILSHIINVPPPYSCLLPPPLFTPCFILYTFFLSIASAYSFIFISLWLQPAPLLFSWSLHYLLFGLSMSFQLSFPLPLSLPFPIRGLEAKHLISSRIGLLISWLVSLLVSLGMVVATTGSFTRSGVLLWSQLGIEDQV